MLPQGSLSGPLLLITFSDSWFSLSQNGLIWVASNVTTAANALHPSCKFRNTVVGERLAPRLHNSGLSQCVRSGISRHGGPNLQ